MEINKTEKQYAESIVQMPTKKEPTVSYDSTTTGQNTYGTAQCGTKRNAESTKSTLYER